VLHGDLLPQNLLFEIRENGATAVVDWECAQIGDPAYDLAIVHRLA
jgi:aminoglycoside phosphotransferase (APT) family kinase protein